MRRSGMTYICDVPEGAQLRCVNGLIVVIAPDMPPHIIKDSKLVPMELPPPTPPRSDSSH